MTEDQKESFLADGSAGPGVDFEACLVGHGGLLRELPLHGAWPMGRAASLELGSSNVVTLAIRSIFYITSQP